MEELKDLMLTAKERWFKKEFSYDGFVISGAICGSKEMHNNYGSTLKAFEYLIKLLDNENIENVVIEKLSKIAQIV